MDWGSASPTALAIASLVGLSAVIYAEKGKVMAREYFERVYPDRKGHGVVANIPFRTFNRELESTARNFNETSSHDKSSREAAIVDTVNAIYSLAKSHSFVADFVVESNDQGKTPLRKGGAAVPAAAPKSVDWWKARYTIRSIFGKNDVRYLPMTFRLMATDRAKQDQKICFGAVESLVVESEESLVVTETRSPSEIALKMHFVLVDSYWYNYSKQESSRLFVTYSQDNQGTASTVITDSDGLPLPLYVADFTLRVEHTVTTSASDVRTRFAGIPSRFDSNTRPFSHLRAPPVRALVLVANGGADLQFLFRALPLALPAVQATWNQKDEAAGVHVHSLLDAPLELVISGTVFPVTLARIATNTVMREPKDLQPDANAVRTVAFATEGDHEFVLDATTGRWTDRKPSTGREVPLPIDSMIDLRVNLGGGGTVVEQGKAFFKRFVAPGFGRPISLGGGDYEALRALNARSSVDNLGTQQELRPLITKQAPEELVIYATLLLFFCVALGAIPGVRRFFARAKRLFIPPLLLAASAMLFYLAYHAFHKKEIPNTADVVLKVCAVVAVTGVVVQLLSGSHVMGQTWIAILGMFFAFQTCALLRSPKGFNGAARSAIGVAAALGAFSCLTLALAFRFKGFEGDQGRVQTPLLLNWPTIVSLFVINVTMTKLVRKYWDRSFERSRYLQEEAEDKLFTPLTPAAKVYYNSQRQTAKIMDQRDGFGIGVALVFGLILKWAFSPVFYHALSRKMKVVPRALSRAAPELLDRSSFAVQFVKIVLTMLIVKHIFGVIVPTLDLMKGGTKKCDQARAALSFFNETLAGDPRCDTNEKKIQILDGMVSMRCYNPVNASNTLLICFLFFAGMCAFATTLHPSILVGQSGFGIFCVFLVYLCGLIASERRSENIMERDVMFRALADYFDKHILSFNTTF